MARGARVGVDVSGPSKGYVVRGTWKPREPDPGKPRDVYAWWWELIQDVQWISDREKVPADGRLLFPSIGEADAARCKSSHLSDVAIYRVHLDGREERLPSYEEALAMRPAVVLVCRDCGAEVERGQRCKAAGCVDPLAALEAAERRLLEAGGWTVAGRDVYGAERWTHPTWKGGAESLSTALTIERRRLAEKGGA